MVFETEEVESGVKVDNGWTNLKRTGYEMLVRSKVGLLTDDFNSARDIAERVDSARWKQGTRY